MGLSTLPDRAMSRARALIRTREPSLLIVAAVIGCLAGLAVTIMSRLAQWLHVVLFSIEPDGFLSATAMISPPWRAAACCAVWARICDCTWPGSMSMEGAAGGVTGITGRTGVTGIATWGASGP